MRATGWYNKPGVQILEGKWQDFIDSEELRTEGFDIIYTDTFSEKFDGSMKSLLVIEYVADSSLRLCRSTRIFRKNSRSRT
jgi:hypothetical protein